MPVLDSALLQSTLRDELRAAWLKIHAEHAQHRLYGFGVYTTDSASYLTVTAFSEDALDDAVAAQVAAFGPGGRHADLREFALKMGGTPDDPALQKQSLRWSPCDSPLHEAGSELLARSDQMMRDIDFEGRWQLEDDARGDEDDDDDDDEDDDLPDPEVEEVFQVIVQVLKALNREGLFGTGAERERLVLSVWQGDQSNESRYAFAKALNPPAVTARFGRELNAAMHAYDRLYHGDEAAREDDVFD